MLPVCGAVGGCGAWMHHHLAVRRVLRPLSQRYSQPAKRPVTNPAGAAVHPTRLCMRHQPSRAGQGNLLSTTLPGRDRSETRTDKIWQNAPDFLHQHRKPSVVDVAGHLVRMHASQGILPTSAALTTARYFVRSVLHHDLCLPACPAGTLRPPPRIPIAETDTYAPNLSRSIRASAPPDLQGRRKPTTTISSTCSSHH